MSVSAGPKLISKFEKFLTNLRKNSPSLSKEQIVEKMIAWVDQNSVDTKSEKALLKQVYLIISPDKLNQNSSENAKYLKKQSEATDYYFIQIRLAFQPMEKSDPDLAEIFGVLNAIKIQATNAAEIHAILSKVLKGIDWSAEKKKMFLRKFSRHFQGTFEEILAKNKPDLQDLTPEQVDAVILYFTEKVSKKDYQVYFKNIEKEIVPPEGFFAKLRFNYRNDMAFMFRILKNSFAEIVLYGILFTAILVIGLAALTLFTLMSETALPLIVALSVIAETAVELAYVVPIIFMAIIPMVAGALHDYEPFDSYFFLAKTIILTAIVGIPSVIFDVVSYPFITIASLFRTKPVVEQEGAKPELGGNPGSEPDPLASVPKKAKKVAQSKKENSGAKKENADESVSSSKRPGRKLSSADADALD